MKCPKCGYPRAKMVVSRSKHWKGAGKFDEGGPKPREDYKAKCGKCGHTWTVEVPNKIEGGI